MRRRSRALHTALVLCVLAAPAAMAGGAYAAEPIGPIGTVDVALPEPTRCDLAAHASPGVMLQVGMYSRDLTTARSDSTGLAIPHTQVDDTWTVPAKSPDDAFSIARHTAWVPAAANSNWINSRPDYQSTGTGVSGGTPLDEVIAIEAGPTDAATPAIAVPEAAVPLPALPSKTTFRATFTVPQQSYLNRLDLTYAADNGVTFYLNGYPIGGFDPTVADVTAFNQERPLAYTGHLLQEGVVNVLDAVVTDYGVATGLLVRGGLSGCLVRYAVAGTCLDVQDNGVYAYPPVRHDISTGSQNGVRDAYGAVDTKWRSVRFWTAPNAYSVKPYNGWFGNLTTANWIHEWPNPSTSGAVTTFKYEIDVPITAPVLSVQIAGRFAADDSAVFRFVNGPVVATGGTWSTTAPLQWAGTLSPGLHKLRADVTDSGLVASGLLVMAEVRICYSRALS